MKKLIGIFMVETGSAIKVVKAWGETPLNVVERKFPHRTDDVVCIDLREYNPETEMYTIKGKEGHQILLNISNPDGYQILKTI